MPDRPRDIQSNLLIVCEGAGDAALIKYLTENRQIGGFHMEDAGGNSKFEAFIRGLPARPGFDRLTGLIVVADNDGGADNSFLAIRNQMKAAKLPCPGVAYKIAKVTKVAYGTYVLMLPFSVSGDGSLIAQTGALETLLLPSAEAHLARLSHCLDSWCECVRMNGWSKTHRDKARLRSLIAAAHPEDPNIGLQWALSPNKNLIPLDNQCFNPLADLLRSLPQLFA